MCNTIICRICGFLIAACGLSSAGAQSIDVKHELTRLQVAMNEMRPLQMIGNIQVTHVHAKMQMLKESRIEFDVTQIGTKFISFMDETRPHDGQLSRQSLACSFDGETFRQDPWGRKPIPGSREAFAASELAIADAASPDFAALCRVCHRLDLARLGMILGNGRMNLTGEVSVIERLSDLLSTDACSAEATFDTNGNIVAVFRMTQAGAFPGLHMFELTFSPTNREVHRIRMIYDGKNATAKYETADWALQLTTIWNSYPNPDTGHTVFPKFVGFQEHHSGVLTFSDNIEVASVRVLPDDAVVAQDFGWSALKLPPGRVTRVSTSSGIEYRTWNGNSLDAPPVENRQVAIAPAAGVKWRRVWWISNVSALVVVLWFVVKRMSKTGQTSRRLE